MSVPTIPPAAPVIVLGAPLSGTDLVAGLLHGAGLFLGNDRNRFGESHFFLDQGRWLFRCAHAEWDVIEPLGWTLADEPACAALAAELHERVEGKGIKGFLGWKTHLRTRSLLGYQEPWGWADTLTSFMLPLWLRVFPTARVIHVVRNGVDVALDLVGREEDRRGQVRSRARSSRCLDPERAFEVWGAYVSAACGAIDRLPAERFLQVRCEDLVRRPAALFEDLATFVGLEPEAEQIEPLLAKLEPLPVEAFRETAAGQALYQRLCGHRMMKTLEYDSVKAAS